MMKKLFINFMLLAAGLLISGNVGAQNVAKVGETNYEDINEAFSAWVTNGGTLTILDDVSYEQSKSLTLESNKEYTLELNGKTLRWTGKLVYEDTDADRANYPNGVICMTTGCETTLNIQSSLSGGNIVFNGEHSYWRISSGQHKQSRGSFYFIKLMGGTLNWKSGDISVNGKDGSEYVSSIIYTYGSAKVDITGGKFTTLDYSYTVIYINSDAEVSLQNCEMKLTSQQKANTGVYCYNNLTKSATLTNVTIDASGVISTKAGKCVDEGDSKYGEVVVNSGTYTANSYSSAYAANGNGIIIKGGTFNGKVKTKSNGIEGGQFSVEPAYNYAAADKHFVKNGDYYELTDGGYMFYNSTLKVAYLDAESCWNECSTTEGTYHTIKPLTSDNFTIPEGRYVNLSVSLSETFSPTITNNGHLQHSSYSWTGGTIINNGEFLHSGMSLNAGFNLTNNGTATFSADADGCSITNNATGVINIQGKSKTYKNITLSNAGIINVYIGTFDQTSYDAFFTNGNANLLGTGSWGTDKNGNPQYVVVADPEAYVGTTGYTTLREALAVSTETKYATLSKDVYITTYNGTTLSGYLDLNGHSIIGKYTYESSALINVSSADLHIKDGSVEQTGKIYRDQEMSSSKDGGIIEVSLGKTVYLEGGSIIGTGANALDYTISTYPNHANNGGHIVIDGATIIGEAYGIAVLDYGTLEIKSGSVTADGYAILNNGSITDPTTITISGGTINGSQMGIYHPGKGTLTISGGEIIGDYTGVEMRAGELNISGGSLKSTYDSFECNPNGNGATTAGAALAIAQHTTKQPITVNISGGHFRGNYAVSQCNPQQNPDEYLDLLDIEVTGGYFLSENGANIISVTENRRLFLKGGVYNLDPAAFTVNGFFSGTNNPELYEGSYAQGYVYKVYQQEIKETETKGTETTDWAQNTTWNTDLVPDYATNVTIGKDIVVTTSAEANKVTIEEGNTLTIKDGGTLIIGNGGIIGATAQTFKVEAGGQVLIAPNAENATLRGSVDLLADRAGLKPSVAVYTGQGSDMYWQHIAIPTDGAPESITPSVTGKTFLNTWNIVNGWQNVGTTALSESFKGYNLGNFHPYSADGSQSITYTFVGKLVGNQPDYMVFAREGHSFFGNSYLAPLDVATMFGTLYNPELEYTLNIYDSQTEMYQPVNEATYAILGIDEIKPLQGFFIYAANATQAQLDYNSAVYTAYLNKHAVGGQTAAPVRRVAKANIYDKMAQITIAATTGEKDVIYLFEDAQFSDAEDNGFDARNLEHSGLDMSIVGSYADLSVLATDNLEGAVLNINTNNAVEYTMTFSHVQGDMTLTDNVTGAVITMQEGATYTFVAQSNAQLNGRFAINAPRRTPTNNENISINPAAKGIYTMMGQYVGDTSKWETLPAGVYVVDGVRVSK